jgi:hypothetical protein
MGVVITESRRVVRPTWWALRVMVTVHLLVVVAQPVLAGRFMAGDYEMLDLHGTIGTVVAVVGMVLVPVAVLCWRPGGGPVWPAWSALGVAVADVVQTFLGFSREIGLHVPLGVGIVVASALLTVAVWRPEPARDVA